MSERDRHTLTELSREELILENRSRVAQHARDSWFNRCHWIVRPFEVCFVDLALSIRRNGKLDYPKKNTNKESSADRLF